MVGLMVNMREYKLDDQWVDWMSHSEAEHLVEMLDGCSDNDSELLQVPYLAVK
jgi:hypothetical protein